MLDISKSYDTALRIEAVDNYHKAWPMVLETIQHLDKEREMQIEPDGWLPARQVLLAGFIQTQVAGFICFNIVPKIHNGALSVDAHIASIGVRPGREEVEEALVQSAHEHAGELNCQSVVSLAA